MGSRTLQPWSKELLGTIALLNSLDLGFPQGLNELRPRVHDVERSPAALGALYAVCDGLSLPDVHVGYFIDSLERVLCADERGEPTSTVGSLRLEAVTVFGSDGGGGRFVVARDDGRIYYLPIDGAVIDLVFFPSPSREIRRIAIDVEEFAHKLLEDVKAFVRDTESHQYLV